MKEGYVHCCGEDMEACRCPQKDSPRFQAKIQDYCQGVEVCKAQMLEGGLSSEVQAKERLEVAGELEDEEGQN